jgi:glycosyltransferase involved in cell wall biosynthesis
MRIIIINPLLLYARGGAEVNDINLGNALRALGHEVIHLAVEDRRKKFYFENESQIECIKMPYYYDIATRLSGPFGKALRTLFFFHFVHRLLKEKLTYLNSADLIFLTGRPILCKARRKSHVTMFFSVRGNINKIYCRLLDQVDGLIFWGGCEKDYPPETINRWPYLCLNAAIQHECFYAGPADPELRAELEDGDDKRIIITYTGRLDPIQQIDQIIHSIAKVYKNGYPVKLILVGDGYIKDELKAIAARENIEDQIIFAGLCRPAKVGEYLRASDIFIMNPRFTSYSLSLKEALACGVFSIAPRTGTVASSLKPNDFARVFPPNDPDALLLTLQQVVEDGVYKKNAKTQTDIIEIHSWKTVAESIVNWSKTIDTEKKK